MLLPKKSLAAVCTGFMSQSNTLTNSTCVISGVMGVDNPMNVETSTTNAAPLILGNQVSNPSQPLNITINAGSAMVAGVVTLRNDVTVAIAEGGQILSGKALYVQDADADGWPSNDTLFTSTASGRRRLGLMRSMTAFDCSDNLYDTVNTSGPWYADTDGDGKGDPNNVSSACSAPVGYTTDNTDCKDSGTNASLVFYGGQTCYRDNDNDNYGVATVRTCMNTTSCATATYGSTGTADDVINSNFATNTTDCYDSNANAYPGSTFCGTSSRGDGSFDYNCSSTSTQCGTVYNRKSVGRSEGFTDICGSCKNCNVRCCAGSNTVYDAQTTACGASGGICTSFTGCTGGSCSRNIGEMCASPYAACEDYHGSAPTCNLCSAVTAGTQGCQ